MKLFLPLLVFMLWQAGSRVAPIETAERQYFRYQRAIAPAGMGQNCAVLDAPTFAHASAALKDLRLFHQTAAAREIPYAVTLSEPTQPDSEPAHVINLGLRGHTIVFDLAMPQRPYTDVVLDLSGRDFIATAVVTGANTLGDSAGTRLGEFTLSGLLKINVQKVEAKKRRFGKDPFTGQDRWFDAKPATVRLKVRPLKKLKDAAV